jgi:hypothetical protein
MNRSIPTGENEKSSEGAVSTESARSEPVPGGIAQGAIPVEAPDGPNPPPASDAGNRVSAESGNAAAETAAPTPVAEAAGTAVADFLPSGDGIREIRDTLAAIRSRLDRLDNGLEATSRQFSLLPAQVRAMGAKIDGMATSIAEPRYRDVLMSLLGLYDLIDQMLRELPPADQNAESAHRRNYEILRTHLHQTLEVNGLSEIPACGAFDPTQHRAVHKVSPVDPALDGQVLEVVRRGFRTERAVLRYADVVVGRYEPAEGKSSETPPTEQPVRVVETDS